MLTQLTGIVVQAAEHEEPAPLIMPFWAFGVILFSILILLMLVTVCFTSVGRRHDPVVEPEDPNKNFSSKHAGTQAGSHH